ncbi:uncharacterized protein LOC128998965 [Macrosteles quadrilineatus]|uniref:uncharacterized protein LOC128998965 n=1 Tax=Macrosteles quadrilineatus TaxID=74068 RepID=UPI0023E2482B|nr:uncharacterized protein LOC128998965 [Macrosteles quadrilineatus]
MLTAWSFACQFVGSATSIAMLKKAYTCASECCDKQFPASIDYLDCLEKCHLTSSEAVYYITSTFNDIKRRYNTCIGKCDSGEGFNVNDRDDEGDDGEITAEELKEFWWPDYSDSEHLMNSWFEQMDDVDLEYQDDENPKKKADLKDRNTCTRLCIESYIHTLNSTMDTMRRDLAAKAIAKSDQASYYYDWSRANEEELPY